MSPVRSWYAELLNRYRTPPSPSTAAEERTPLVIPTEPLPRRRNDAKIALVTITVCLASVLALQLIARDAPSAGRSMVVGIPTPNVTAAEGCDNFASFWMDEKGVGATAEQIEGITNCRRSADGEWIVPSSAQDARLAATPILDDAQRSATAPLRAEILDQINDLDGTIPSTLRTWLSQIYDPFPRAVIGHVRDGVSIRTQRNRYNRLAQAYLMAPEREALAEYVGWVMGRRIGHYEAIKSVCLNDPNVAYLRNACLGLEDNLSIRSIPFTWDLRDSYLLDSYLATVDPDTIATRVSPRENGPS